MPQLSDKEFYALLAERDPFKLAIRGHTAVEADIDAAISEAFTGQVPRQLHELGGFKTRLTLVVALGILPEQYKPSIEALAKLRHDFAHGRIADLNRQRADSLARAFEPVIGANAFEAQPPIHTLRAALIAARTAVRVSADAARQRRREQQRLVGLRRAIQTRLRELREQVTPDAG
jgi:hypothetical protein